MYVTSTDLARQDDKGQLKCDNQHIYIFSEILICFQISGETICRQKNLRSCYT